MILRLVLIEKKQITSNVSFVLTHWQFVKKYSFLALTDWDLEENSPCYADFLKSIFLTEKSRIYIEISPRLLPEGQINNSGALV